MEPPETSPALASVHREFKYILWVCSRKILILSEAPSPRKKEKRMTKEDNIYIFCKLIASNFM